jgi:hypothetical protein
VDGSRARPLPAARTRHACCEESLWLGTVGSDDQLRHQPNAPPTGRVGRCRTRPPASSATPLHPFLARRRRRRAPPHAHRRLVEPEDARPLRHVRRQRARPPSSPAPVARQPRTSLRDVRCSASRASNRGRQRSSRSHATL